MPRFVVSISGYDDAQARAEHSRRDHARERIIFIITVAYLATAQDVPAKDTIVRSEERVGNLAVGSARQVNK